MFSSSRGTDTSFNHTYLCHWMMKRNKKHRQSEFSEVHSCIHIRMHPKQKKSLGYNLQLCMRQLYAWLLACKITLICDQTQMFFFRNVHGHGLRKMSNCTYGNNLKSYIVYKRVNRKAKGETTWSTTAHGSVSAGCADKF